MGKSRPLSILISANQIHEFGSSQSLWDTAIPVNYNKQYYYSFKNTMCVFPHFGLVKTTYIYHHNQLLLTKFQFERIFSHWTNHDDIKRATRCRLLIRWHQNDVKSAAHCRLLNRWPREPEDKVVLFLVSRKWLWAEFVNILNK